MKTKVLAICLLAACQARGPMSVEPAGTEPDDVATIEQAVTASNWLPLQTEGNNWFLQNKTDSRAISVDYVEERIAFVSGLFPGSDGRYLGWAKNKPSDLYLWDDAAQEWRIFIRFGRSVGTIWNIKGGACSTFTAKVSSKTAKVKTPAGDFKNGYTVQFTQHPSSVAKCAAPFTRITFVENVGLVKIDSPMFSSPVLLTSAKINGKTYGGSIEPIKLAELEADPKAFNGQTITVVGEPIAGAPICTKMACMPSNPCCNKCGASLKLGTSVTLTGADVGCSGNDCSLTCNPFSQGGNGDYAITGVFTYGEYGSELAVESFKANTCQRSGCSGQVCANTQQITTCAYMPQYECYANAACEVAADGHCGWTPAADVAACLANF